MLANTRRLTSAPLQVVSDLRARTIMRAVLVSVLLALGLLSRITALGIVIDMVVAYLSADREAFTSFISNPDKFVAASPFVFLFAGLIVLFFGPGKYAIDSLLAKKLPART